jgi:hypothetical protein
MPGDSGPRTVREPWLRLDTPAQAGWFKTLSQRFWTLKELDPKFRFCAQYLMGDLHHTKNIVELVFAELYPRAAPPFPGTSLIPHRFYREDGYYIERETLIINPQTQPCRLGCRSAA